MHQSIEYIRLHLGEGRQEFQALRPKLEVGRLRDCDKVENDK